MSLDLSPASLLNAGTGLVFAIVGLFFLRVRPRRPVNVAFATFAVAFGLFLLYNLLGPDDPLGPAFMLFVPVVAAGILLLAVRAGSHPGESRLRPALGAAIVGIFCLVVEAIGTAAFLADPHGIQAIFDGKPAPSTFALVVVGFLGSGPVQASFWAALFYLGLCERADEHRNHDRALLSAALVVYPAFYAGSSLVQNLQIYPPGFAYDALAYGGPMVALAAVWLWTMRGSESHRLGRSVAWITLGAGLAGALQQAALPSVQLYGLARVASVLILAYAILRHQLLGLDVKVRWGISRGSLAAIFLIVFFVASQIAQQYLQTQGVLMGGVAAGLLLFGLSPLQRVADRIADAAVPGAARPVAAESAGGAGPRPMPVEPGVSGAPTRSQIYKDALRLALADRVLSHEDERVLAHLAQQLGIGAGTALDLRHEVEADLGGGASARKEKTRSKKMA